METGQGQAFFILMVTGFFLAFLFDGYRLLRRWTRLKRLATALGDFLYCLLATGIIFYSMVFSNWGEWRFYVFFSLFGGWILYYRFLSRLVLQFFWQCLRKK